MTTKMLRVILASSGLAVAAFSLAQATLTGVETSKEKQTFQIVGTGLSKPSVTVLNGGKNHKFVFDGNLSGSADYKRVRANGLRYVSYGWQNAKPPQVWVLFVFDEPQKPQITQNATGWSVTWGNALTDAAPNAITSVNPTAQSGPAEKVQTPTKATEPASPRAAPFPDRVPPLEPAHKVLGSKDPDWNRMVADSAPNTIVFDRPSGDRVTLDFVETNVVQILKALSLQAGVNIVTSPEVKGAITVALANVTVTEALDFVTSMAGLRYAKVNNTFVVTPVDKFAMALQQIGGNLDVPSETRVVNLESGEGVHIKAAVLKAIPQDTLKGRYEIVLPSERLQIKSLDQATMGANGKSGSQGASSGQGGQASATSTAIEATAGITDGAKQKDPYLVLIGSRARLGDVEHLVRELDQEIIRAARLGVAANIDTRVVPIYSSQLARIREAVKNLIDRDPNSAAFQVSDSVATDVGAESSQSLLMLSGPTEALDKLDGFARSLDRAICDATSVHYPETAADAERLYQVIDLKYVEPIEAAFELQQRIRGLQASLMPSPVDPLMSGGTFTRKKDSELWEQRDPKGNRTLGQGGTLKSTTTSTAQGGEAGGQASAQGQGGEAERAAAQGMASQTSRELGSEPMQLLIRGTKAQIAEAFELIGVIDKAPKMVAVDLRVVSLSKEEAIAMGIDWSLLTGGTVQPIRVNQGTGATASSPGTISGTLRWAGGGTTDILATLDQLAGTQKLIARPNLIAIHGKPASLFVGEKVQYIKTIQASQQGTSIIIGELNVGVEMSVVARIGADGKIALDLGPSLTILKGFTPVPGGGNLPQTIERYTQSQVILNSGETIALGGMIQDDDRRTTSGIPILKDLPIIGALFSRTERTKDRTEVVFFLTVREVSADDRGRAADPTQKGTGEGTDR